MKILEIHRDKFGEYAVKNDNKNKRLKSFVHLLDAVEYCKLREANTIKFYNYKKEIKGIIDNIDKRSIIDSSLIYNGNIKICPKCNIKFDEKNLLFSIEIQGKYDGITYYQCSSCLTFWSAFTGLEIINVQKEEEENVHKRF